MPAIAVYVPAKDIMPKMACRPLAGQAHLFQQHEKNNENILYESNKSPPCGRL